MADASKSGQRMRFFPKADAAVLSSRHGPPPTRPQTIWPIYDPDNLNNPIAQWSQKAEELCYPPKAEEYAPSSIPDTQCLSDRYLRASLAKNERLRLSMLWYYTRDIFSEGEFLCGLREKVLLACESTGWEFAVIGLLDINIYIRLATIGLPLAILPRGETICAHTVTQPPGSVFLLPNMMEDWRFRESPYVESGGLVAYAGAPLRLQNDSGDTVGLGSLCVASATSQPPLTKSQQSTLARLSDWVVADIIQCARVRRQRERHRMTELISTAQAEMDQEISEEPIFRILQITYPDSVINLQSSKALHIEIDGRDPILSSDLEEGIWEDIDFLDDFIANSNHQEFPCTRVVRIIATQCESILGPSLLVVGSKDMRLVFDDIDAWFVQACAAMITQMWHKRLLAEAMKAKEKFLRGFSHQLRTPIHGILGSAELLAEELKTHDSRETTYQVSALLEVGPVMRSGGVSIYLDTIKSAGRDLISIVNSMITLNRWADIAMKDRCYDAHTIYQLETDLIKETLAAISGDTRYNASILFNQCLPTDHDGVQIDLGLLRNSLLPLVINAIQNTSAGVVVVTTSLQPGSRELVVDIEDTGCGIHSDDQQRIFEPYEKVGAHSAGAGLGLTLASKFATLLHGSVDLVSSEIGRGSHFRAKFREVECISSPLPSEPLVSKLKNLPQKFYYKASGLEGASLCAYFARFLTCQGFTASDSMEDCFVILDFVPELGERRSFLSQIPSEQVAICLVPATESEASTFETFPNVVFVRGPFLTSTMVSALLDADELITKIQLPMVQAVESEEPPSDIPKLDGGLSTEKTTGHMIHADFPEQGFSKSPADSSLPTITPPPPDTVLHVETSIVVPVFSTLRSTTNPTALLVDDNDVNLRIMQMYCKKRGLPYLSASDGKEAVELYSKHQHLSAIGEGAPIELIMMDLQMPVCDGIDATKQIRLLETKNHWDKSVICIVTGQDSPKDRLDAECAGADDYYVKPVGIKLLDRGLKQYFPAFEAC